MIKDLCEAGTRAAIVLTAGLAQEKGADGRTLQQQTIDTARSYNMRILGPTASAFWSPASS